LTMLYKLSAILGFNFDKVEVSQEELNEKIGLISKALETEFKDMNDLLEFRKLARLEKNWDLADKIRIALDEVGISLKDSKEGTTWELKG